MERLVPESRGDVNWALQGVQYGKAERAKCDAAISGVVERLQHEYVIAGEFQMRFTQLGGGSDGSWRGALGIAQLLAATFMF